MSASVFGSNRYEYFKNVGGLSHAPKSSRSISTYAKNVRGIPQVVFKSVKSGFASGYIGLSAQMSYVLGKAERVIDPSGHLDGECQVDRKVSDKLASKWVDSWQKTAKDGKHSMHLVASFPEKTPVGIVECIVRDTCEELLSQGRNRFEFVAAIHSDTSHPHGHIIVNRRNAEGEWFYLAKDHEYNYDVFKDSLVSHAARYGVELVNSSRLSRGITDYPTDSRNVAMKGLEGKIVRFDYAPYQHKSKGSDSFYITLNTKFGERTLWGLGLADVLNQSSATVGDTVLIRHEGKKPIQLTDKQGNVIQAHRNSWMLKHNGYEYGLSEGNSEVTKPDATNAAVDRRSAVIVREAGIYQRFSQAVSGTYTALHLAFNAAATSLRSGRTVNDYINFMESKMTSNSLDSDTNQLMQKIDTAKDQLASVWENIPHMSPVERPEVESRYFEAVGNLDHILIGERRREFVDKAEDTIYSDEHRKKFGQRLPPQSIIRLEQYGIKTDEIEARSKVENVSNVLEAYWLERDAQAIAAHQNIDMTTENGRELAFKKVEELHTGLMGDVDGLQLGNRADWNDYRQVSQDIANAADADRQAEIKEHVERVAAKSPAYAELVSHSLDAAQPHGQAEYKGYIQPADRHLTNAIAEANHFDLSDKRGYVDLDKLVERQNFGLSSHDTISNIRDLTRLSSNSFEDNRRLIEGMEEVLGKQGLRDLQNGNVSNLAEKFKEAGINIDQKEAFAIADKYVTAMKDHGYDMKQTEKSLEIEKNLSDLETDKQQLETERSLAESKRQDDLKDTSKLGL